MTTQRDAEILQVLLAQKDARRVAELNGQFAESAKLEAAIRENLAGLGYGE